VRNSLVVIAWAWVSIVAAGAAVPQDKAPEDDLPAGPGKVILDRACTSCHGLNEVTKFKDYWDRKQWQDAVGTMIDYGAEVNESEAKVLTDYLFEHLGRKEK
jgi:mono/diheme cytochrome c family protein